ncbi:MAG: hypothetical protein AAFY26_12010 [Cyanobacteria bacterium J06638_22]
MSKLEDHTVKFENPWKEITVQVQTVSDAIDIAVERTGISRDNICEVEFPDKNFGGTTSLTGSALYWSI